MTDTDLAAEDLAANDLAAHADPVGPSSLGLDHPPTLRPSLLVVLLLDVLALGTWASWSVVQDRALRGVLVSAFLAAPFVAAVIARPVARRLAFQSAQAGPTRRWPIVVSVLLATALSTMAVVSLDSLSHSSATAVREQLGAVDEVVVANRPEARAAAQERIAAAMVDDDAEGRATPLAGSIDAQLALTTLDVTARAGGAAFDATAIEIDVPTVQRFGQSASAVDVTGFAGQEPLGATDILLGRDLADDLGVVAGADVTIDVGDAPKALRVKAVLPRLGVAGLSVDGRPRPRVAFVAPGLLTTAAGDAYPPSYLLAISNTGDVQDGADLSELVTARLEELFQPESATSTAASDTVTGGATTGDAAAGGSLADGVTVVPVKRDLQLRVEREVAPLRQLFASLTAVAVAVAALFLALLMGQFVTRRRQAIVALRLIGVRRLDVAAAVGIEAWFTAVPGVLAGSGLGYLLSMLLGSVAGVASSSSGVALTFAPVWSSAVVGATVGLGLATAAIVVPLLALARRPVLADLREAHRPFARRDRWTSAVLLAAVVVGVAAVLRGIRGDHALDVFLGAGLLALAATTWMRIRRLRSEPRATAIVSAVVLAGVATARWTRPDLVRSMATPGFVALAVVTLGAAGLLSAALARPIGTGIAWTVRTVGDRRTDPGGKRSVVDGIGAAARRSEPVRTLLFWVGFAAMFFLIAASWSLSATLQSRIGADVVAARGGWDVTVRADRGGPAMTESLRSLPGVAAIARFGSRTVMVGAAAARVTAPVTVLGIDPDYLEREPARLAQRRDGAFDDRAVYDAVLADPTLVIVDPVAVPRGRAGRDVAPGDTLFLRDPQTGRSAAFTVAGTLRSGVGLAPVLASRDALGGLGSGSPSEERAVIAVEGADAGKWVAAPSEFGGSLRTFDDAAERDNAAPRELLRMVRAFMVLSALLSLGALAAATAEQVRRRQREFATLRSIGLDRQGLRAAVLVPTLVLVADAGLVGSALGVLGAANLIHTGVLGPARLQVPWPMILGALVAAVALSLAVAWRPAAKAAALPPMRAMG